MIRFLLCLVFGLLAEAKASPEEAQRYFEQGNAAAAKKQHDAAIEAYSKALSYGSSASLHFNLANTFREAGMNGSAVLHYERALLLDPVFPQARQNLELLRTRQGLSQASYNFLEEAAAVMSARSWSVLLTASFWVIVAGFVLPRFHGGGRTWITLTVCAAFLLLGASLIALLGWRTLAHRAVVLDQPSPLRVAPAKDALSNGNLTSGELATIERSHLDYHLVRSHRGQTGWLHASEIKPLIP